MRKFVRAGVTLALAIGVVPLGTGIAQADADTTAPVVSGISSAPDPINVPGTPTLHATIDDSSTGGSTIASADYSVDGGAWTPLAADDAAFDGVSEAVSASIPGLAAGNHTVAVRGTDSSANTSDGTTSTTVHVLAAPTITIAPGPLVQEGNGPGTTTANISVTLSAKSTEPVSVHWQTNDSTATDGDDYTGASGTLSWPAQNNTAKVIPVSIIGDTLDEDDEEFTVTLDSPVNASIFGSGISYTYIIDDDGPVRVNAGPDRAVVEGKTKKVLKFQATLDRPSGKEITVDYATSDGSALHGKDYVRKSGTVTFEPGSTTATIRVPIKGDLVKEPDEVFYVSIRNPSNALLGDSVALGLIVNDD